MSIPLVLQLSQQNAAYHDNSLMYTLDIVGYLQTIIWFWE